MDSLPDLQPVSDSDDSEMEENLPDNLDNMDSLPDLESVELCNLSHDPGIYQVAPYLSIQACIWLTCL
jgi:hypothetical protein